MKNIMRSDFVLVAEHKPFTVDALDGKPVIGVLNEGIRALEEFGADWQLGSGTLLGMIREEKKYIAHDTDIDIDVFIHTEQQAHDFSEHLGELITTFSQHGFSIIRTQHYKHNNAHLPMQIAFIHDATKIIYDLCVFYQLWGDDYLNIYEHGVFVRPKSTVWSVLFEGYNVPPEPKNYLAKRFGDDWETPKNAKECGSITAGKYLVIL